MSYFIFASAVLLIANHVKCNETCSEIFRVDEKDGLDFLLLCSTDCFPRFMGIRRKQDDFYINQWNTTTPRMNYTLKAYSRYFSFMDQAKYVCAITYLDGSSVMKETEVVFPGIPRVLVRNVTDDDFGEYSLAVMAMARKVSVPSSSRLQILHKIPPRLCQGQDNVTKLVARPGTNAVMTICFEADMPSANWPVLNVSGHWIRPRVNFTYVTDGSVARRHELKVSFNNISVNDYGLVNLVLMTGYQVELKFSVRIQAQATCGVLFKVKEVDEYEKSFTLICRSPCYPRYIRIGMKMQSFYRTTLYNPRANMTRELRDGPRHFSCADEGIYVCNITYYGGETVVKQRIVDFQSCHHNASTKARSPTRIL